MYSKELVYVTTIAESGSLSAAAKKLSMTQPALSIFLSNLEVELEAPLFTRNGRRMVPTKAGELYLSTAKKILDLEEYFHIQLDSLLHSENYTLRIGLPWIQAPFLIPPIMDHFSKMYPGVSLRFSKSVLEDLTKKLENDQLDIVFMSKVSPHLNKDIFQYLTVTKDYLLLVVPKNTNWRFPVYKCEISPYQYVELSDFQDIPFITQLPSETIYYLEQKAFRRWNLTPSNLLSEGGLETAHQMTQHHMGCSFTMRRYLSHDISPDLNYYLIGDPPISAPISLVFRQCDFIPPYIHELARFLKTIIQ